MKFTEGYWEKNERANASYAMQAFTAEAIPGGMRIVSPFRQITGEKYPVKKYLKRTEGKNTVTVTFTNVKKGTWYVTIRAWNQTSKDKSRAYSPYSTMKKFKTKK